MSASQANSRPKFKQQKVRKGTFSCWECKKRKIRCRYQPPSGSTCVSCCQRGVECISQEYIQVDENDGEYASERIDQIEGMVNQFLRNQKKINHLSDKTKVSLQTSVYSSTLDYSPCIDLSRQQVLNEASSLSYYLYTIMPPTTVTMTIFSQSNYFQMPFHMFRRKENTQIVGDKNEYSLLMLSKRLPPTAHPVVFAQRLYRLALCMLQLDPTTTYETKQESKEFVRDASQRFFGIASKHVTSHDTLMESLDGLEVLMLESGYHVNMGDHRAAWLTLRRALGLAELMGLREKKSNGDNPGEFVWYLLNYCDRFLSVMFGLPCNSTDDSFATDRALIGKNPTERVSCTHVAVIGHIITRNLQIQPYEEGSYAIDDLRKSYKQTQKIDHDLKLLIKILPMDSWVTSSLSYSATDKDIREKTSTVLLQIHHSYLLLLLHLPYLLRWLYLRRLTETDETINYTYSRLAALSASRDMLTRFLAMRNIHHTVPYQGFDHKVWIASVTLLLIHIDYDHQPPSNNPLGHQRQQDLAIIHKLIQRSKISASISSSVQRLCSLLKIEENAASGVKYDCKWNKNCTSASCENTLQLVIPYFGTISISLCNLDTTITSPETEVSGFNLAQNCFLQDSDAHDHWQLVTPDFDNSYPFNNFQQKPMDNPFSSSTPTFSLDPIELMTTETDSILQ